jgi:tight adherence protein B
MLISTVIFLFFLLLTYALFLFASRKSEARSTRLQHRVAEALQESSSLSLDEALHITRDDSLSSNATLNRLLSSLDFVKKLDVMISQADIQVTVSKLLAFCFAGALMAGLAAYTVLNSISAVLIALVAGVLPVIYVGWKRRQRLDKFNSLLPDTLDLLSRSLSVGHAFSEALNQVSGEMPDPISTEFSYRVRRAKTRPVHKAGP